ncbi:hypothetical protein B0T10DRAFT_419160 [Thelonectria olida]|uniref:Zn(2)-C6 fungal-type domain-containing protein n=1 Tax=Thelonectria olida TaxID=1576542 RepID=A0A9P8VN78_9HYPO|nr:hypothetical protein B0T10DRAFT_419160 [Thelonectria olida]
MSQEHLPTTSNSSPDGDAIVVARGVTEPPVEQEDVSSRFPKPFTGSRNHLFVHTATNNSRGRKRPLSLPRLLSHILKRHVGTHIDPKAGRRTGPAKRRTRAARACTFCAESKLRCEGTDPCQRCRDRGLECRYTQRSRARKGPGGLVLEGTRVRMAESPAPSDEGDAAPPSGETEESTYHLAPASFTDASDMSQSVSEPRVDSLADKAVQPFTPMSFETGNPSLLMDDADLFADFLKDIIYGGSNDEVTQSGPATSSDPMPMDILNFGPLGVTSPGIGSGTSRESSRCYPPMARQEEYPHVEWPADMKDHNKVSSSEDAFRQSLWSWTPREGEHWRSQTTELILCLDDLVSGFVAQSPQTYACPPLLASTRHRLVSMMLPISGEGNYERIISTFPSVTTLDYLLSKDLQRRSIELDSWIHLATFNPNLACPQLVLGLIISGAFRCGHPLFRKLGLALLELHMELSLQLFSSNARNARLIAPIQTFAITIEAGLWSGDGRRLELCEAFSNSLITAPNISQMARRAGYFQLGPFHGPPPYADDSSDVLDIKWRTWVDHESMKRLAIHLLNICTQFSMALLTTPLVTFIEMSVPLPAARSLWNASSAEDWRSAYLALENQNLTSLPPLRSCYSNFVTLQHLGDVHDAPCTGLAILSGLWLHIWQYKQRVSAHNTSPYPLHANSALIIQSLQQEARENLEDFKNGYAQLNGSMEPSLLVLHEQLLMHLYISLEDVQYLGGKAGDAEARRALPLLTRWVTGRASRQAVWHAGQILRAGRQELNPALRASTIMALYHASLTLWVYSILSSDPSLDMPVTTSQRQLPHHQSPCVGSEPLALVDGDDTPAVQRFLMMASAKAAINPHAEDVQPIVIHISRAPTIMTAIATLLKENSGSVAYRDCPSLVDNLTRLVEQLGRAAESVHKAVDVRNVPS